VRADRAFLALPKYVGFFEAFLKHEPAAATDMSADKTLLQSAAYLSCPLIEWSMRPTRRRSHQGSGMGCL
jgi:hypothetical protein